MKKYYEFIDSEEAKDDIPFILLRFCKKCNKQTNHKEGRCEVCKKKSEQKRKNKIKWLK